MTRTRKTADANPLGPVIERFRSDVTQIVGGWAGVSLLIPGGAAWVIFFLREAVVAPGNIPNGTPLKALIASTFGMLLLAGGIGVLVYVLRLTSTWVELCEGGVRVSRRRLVREFQWSEIGLIAETVILDRHRLFDSELANRLMPTYKDRRVEIHTRLAESVAFNDEWVAKINRFCRLLRELADRHGVKWDTTERDDT